MTETTSVALEVNPDIIHNITSSHHSNMHTLFEASAIKLFTPHYSFLSFISHFQVLS